MTTEKTKRTRTAKTDLQPVADVATFFEGLPAVGFCGEFSAWADVAFRSGYFGDDTPAQLAIKILVGESLGLTIANALFEIEIRDGVVRWKGGGSGYQETIDEIERKAAQVNAVRGVARSDNDANDVVDDRKPTPVIAFTRAEGWPSPEGDDANKGPVLETDGQADVEGLEPKQSDPGQESGETAAELTPVSDDVDAVGPDPDGSEPWNAVAEEPTGPPEPEPAAADNAVPGVEGLQSSASAVLDGIEVGATINNWRTEMAARLIELGFSREKIDAKLDDFDAATTTGKRALVNQAKILYSERLTNKRIDVLVALAKDGKTSLDAQRGFYFYAEVGDDPDVWTYTEAAKAWAVLERDFPDVAKSVTDSPPEQPAAA